MTTLSNSVCMFQPLVTQPSRRTATGSPEMPLLPLTRKQEPGWDAASCLAKATHRMQAILWHSSKQTAGRLIKVIEATRASGHVWMTFRNHLTYRICVHQQHYNRWRNTVSRKTNHSLSSLKSQSSFTYIRCNFIFYESLEGKAHFIAELSGVLNLLFSPLPPPPSGM